MPVTSFVISRANGELLENGWAVKEVNGVYRRYTCGELNLDVPGTIISALAWDIAWNETKFEVKLK